MAITVEVSEIIECPVAEVFHFYADHHVRNHPRWDTDIELWVDHDAALAVGTVIRRRNSRSGTPVEGTMEVTEFERDSAFGVLIKDGPMTIPGRATFEAVGSNSTRLVMTADFPVDESMREVLSSAMKRSVTNIKQMLESGAT